MPAVDHAKFIVRHTATGQWPEYSLFCAEATEALLANPPSNANALVERISESMQAYRDSSMQGILFSQPNQDRQPEWGEIRDKTKSALATPFTNNPRYESAWEQLTEDMYPENLDQTGASKEITHKARHDDRLPPIMLSKFVRNGRGKIHHGNADEYNNEFLWAEISQAYLVALDKKQDKAKRQDAALECYALLSHDTPLNRGSATLARIALEFLAHSIGFEVPHTKYNMDLNIQAQITTPQRFIERFKRGDYFDTAVTSAEVLRWQAKTIAFQLVNNNQEKFLSALANWIVQTSFPGATPVGPTISTLMDGSNELGLQAHIEQIPEIGHVVSITQDPAKLPPSSEEAYQAWLPYAHRKDEDLENDPDQSWRAVLSAYTAANGLIRERQEKYRSFIKLLEQETGTTFTIQLDPPDIAGIKIASRIPFRAAKESYLIKNPQRPETGAQR